MIDKRIHLKTPGMGDGAPQTTLLFAKDKDGLHLESNVRIDPLMVRGAGSRKPEKAGKGGTIGILMRAGSHLEFPYVERFSGNGIAIVADVKRKPPTNANNWYIFKGRSIENGGNGIYIEGGDTNTGYCFGLNVSQNAGWGAVDSSFLGSVWHKLVAVGNETGAFLAEGESNRARFLDCYVEGSAPIRMATQAEYLGQIGGKRDPKSTGITQIDRITEGGPEFASLMTEERWVKLRLGSKNTDRTALELEASDHKQPVRLRRGYPTEGRWGFQPGSATTGPFSFDDVLLYAPQGIALGSTGSEVPVSAASAPPKSGQWKLGAFLLNSKPSAGSPLGWRCIEAGTPGRWESVKLAN